MGKMKVIKDTSLIPMDVSTTSAIKTHSGGDTKDSFLNAKIDKEIQRATDRENNLQEQIDVLKEKGFSVKDVVATHQDLLDYNTHYLIQDDIIVVLDDGDCSAYYRWDGTKFNSLGASSYTIDKIDNLIQELQSQIDYLGQKGAIRDVVLTHQALIEYDTTSLVEGDILIVLVDEILNSATTYYKMNSQGVMVVCGSVGPNYYNKKEIDDKVEAIYEILDDHNKRITDNRNELNDRTTEEEAYNILVG